MVKRTENGRSARWLVSDKGPKSMIDMAISEVQRILRSAKNVKIPTTLGSDLDGDACALWASSEDGFLDSLW